MTRAPGGPARQLARGDRRAADDRGDLVEGQGEHVVQHEGEPLGGGELFEHHEQREADGIGQERLVLGVGPVRAVHDRVGYVRVQGPLPRFTRAQHVQAHPRHDRRQPPAGVLDLAGLRAGKAEPGLLDSVVGLAQRTEHPVSHRP